MGLLMMKKCDGRAIYEPPQGVCDFVLFCSAVSHRLAVAATASGRPRALDAIDATRNPRRSERGFELLEDDRAEDVAALAALGLQRVGWIVACPPRGGASS